MISEYPCSSLHTSTMHATTQMHKLNFRPNITTDIHSYAVKFDTIQHHRARRRVNMTNTDIDVQQVLFICHLADLHLPLSPCSFQSEACVKADPGPESDQHLACTCETNILLFQVAQQRHDSA